jgi:serine palmitoyltransferase
LRHKRTQTTKTTFVIGEQQRASLENNQSMLFPAIHELGFQLGLKAHAMYHQTTPLPTPEEAIEFIKSIPWMYKDWWLGLVANDPLHVVVETVLLASIIYMIAARNTEGYKHQTEKLTEKEQQELLSEWKRSRAPLAAPNSEDESSDETAAAQQIIVHKQQGRFLEISQGEDTSETKTVLNFGTFDFLGMQNPVDNKIKQASIEALKKYGCGSCGPRGFYGTIDTHLQLEDEISKFTSTDGAIMYSDGASTCTSTVAAFAKRGDLLVVDEGVYEPLLTGVILSRANVKWFRHNDPDDLERVLKEVQRTDEKLKRKSNAQRRFIVTEGLFKNLGTICPLDKIVELKHKYHYRLILDESFSFGSLGPNGKGVLDLYNLRPMYDAEIITIALENSLGSIGGVTVGNEEVVDHQRLSGAGYCFSASAPPFTATAAVQAIQCMKSQPELVSNLHSNVALVYEKLANLELLVVASDERSPIVVLQLEQERPDEQDILREIHQECLSRDIAMVATGQAPTGGQLSELAPALRITISTLHSTEDIEKLVTAIQEAVSIVSERYPPKIE